MTDLTSFAFLATLAAFWTQFQSLLDRFRGIFIQRDSLNGSIATAVSDFLFSQARVIRWGDSMIRSESAWVRPAERVMEVAYESTPTKPVLAFWNGKPLLFHTPNHASSAPGVPDRTDFITLTSLRGCLNLTDLTKAALDWQCLRETTGRRYRVRHIGGQDSHRPNPTGQLSPPAVAVGSSGGLRPGSRLLHWSADDIGSPRAANPFESYALSQAAAEARADFQRWCGLKKWYLERGIPWRRGHLLYGPPGTGKTALVRSLAQEADFPVFAFDLSTLSNDEFRREWMDMQESAPCIALIEDIDGVFHGRENVLTQRDHAKSSLTFDCLLNALGGIQTADGVFVVITTNKPETLDEALGRPDALGTTSRPGRLDRAFFLPVPDRQARACIIQRITGECVEADLIATENMTAAQVTEWSICRALETTWKNPL